MFSKVFVYDSKPRCAMNITAHGDNAISFAGTSSFQILTLDENVIFNPANS